jgi:hypothetical protein
MKVYLFMGTHLPELSRCLEELALTAALPDPVQELVPAGLDWPARPAELIEAREYDPETVEWTIGPDSETTTFIVLDPRLPQVPQLELLAEALREAGIEPVKVVTCVDSGIAEASPQYRTWLEASIYYSDIVLLGNRAKASKSFLREFQKGYEKQCYPCQFLLLKGPGSPDHPLEILAPYTRRIAQLFDLEEAEADPLPGVILEASCDLDLEEPEVDPFRSSEDQEAQTPPALPNASQWIVTLSS